MSQAKRSRKSRDLTPVHSAAAAIDIGATIHVAAVGPDERIASALQQAAERGRSRGGFSGAAEESSVI